MRIEEKIMSKVYESEKVLEENLLKQLIADGYNMLK